MSSKEKCLPNDHINEPTRADAIMVRLSANANKIELKGDHLKDLNLENWL